MLLYIKLLTELYYALIQCRKQTKVN